MIDWDGDKDFDPYGEETTKLIEIISGSEELSREYEEALEAKKKADENSEIVLNYNFIP